ncbi:hypothetical protein BDAP_001210 [Binucleata daphniae]
MTEKKEIASFDLKNFSMKKIQKALEKYENQNKDKLENNSETVKLYTLDKSTIDKQAMYNAEILPNDIQTSIDRNNKHVKNLNDVNNGKAIKNIKSCTNKTPADKNQSVYKDNFDSNKNLKFIGSENANDEIYVGQIKEEKNMKVAKTKNTRKTNFDNCLITTKDDKMFIDLTKKKEYTKNAKKDWCNVKTYTKMNDNNSTLYECPICFTESIQNVQLECTHLICFKCISRIYHILKEKQCPICKTAFHIEIPATLTKPKCQLCPFIGSSLFELQNHYKSHGKLLCVECTTNKAEFASEYTLYTTENLGLHLKRGLCEENANNFYGHIYCLFCHKYFYNADACVKHCRKQHALCTICESMKKRHVYLNDMNDLKKHMNDLHFMCTFKGCEGIGFGHNAELVTHLLRIHKIGDGRVDLNPKKRSSVGAFCPYEIEEENKNKIKGNTKGYVSNASWEYEKVDENNFSYKDNQRNGNNWIKREFVFLPKQTEKKSFGAKYNDAQLFKRADQLNIEAENVGLYFGECKETHKGMSNKHDVLKTDKKYKQLIEQSKTATFKKYNSDEKHANRKTYEKITAINYTEETQKQEIATPEYLKREIIKKEVDFDKTLKNSLTFLYPQFWEEIHKIVCLFLNRQINVETFFERCEFVLGDKDNVKFMSYITKYLDNDSVKVVNEYYKGYKERVTFPPFEKNSRIVKKQPLEKKYSFKIIDMTKKDKK